MIDTIANSLSYITRSLAFVPGMYFVTKPLHQIFTRHYAQDQEHAWRVISLNGYRMKVNMAHRMASLIYWRGAHEWAPMFLMQKELKKGMTYYDIGANIGEFTLFAANLLGDNGKVCSFEPMNDTYQVLLENIALNKFEKRVAAFPIALSDHNGEAELFAATEYTDLGSTEDGFHTIYARDDRSVLLYKIKLETMDGKQGEIPPPDFVKIDVEGAELSVLKGAQETLKKHHPKILMEFSSVNATAAGYKQSDLLDILRPMGYKFYTIENRGKLLPLDESTLPEFANLYCI
ncbi:MAG: FkbM family methyltransferase [Bacteroidetes bacterium]|nr:FkbM family methyltransferase [Bacteroidota bacterium]